MRQLAVDTDLKGLNDDAFALHYLAARGRWPDLLTTVFGNTTAAVSEADARHLTEVEWARRVPVVRGADRPLHWDDDRRAHMRRLLDGLPADRYLAGIAPDGPLFRDGHLADDAAATLSGFLVASAAATVMALGPLTNVARACATTPAHVLRRHELVFCGSSLRAGNITAYSEFNAFADPHALHQALAAPWRSVLVVPLDVTEQVDFGAAEVRRLAAGATGFGRAVAYSRADLHRRDPHLRELMWDAVAAVATVRPEVVTTSWHGPFAVDLVEHPGRLLPAPGTDAPTIRVVTGVDADALREEFIGAFEGVRS